MAVLTTRMFYVHEKQIKHTENDDSKHWSPVINLNRHGNARVKGPLNEFIKHKEWACYLLLASRFFVFLFSAQLVMPFVRFRYITRKQAHHWFVYEGLEPWLLPTLLFYAVAYPFHLVSHDYCTWSTDFTLYCALSTLQLEINVCN